MPRPFRFILSSDWHLERPVQLTTSLSDHLRPALIDAPFRAAERVVDAALKERVDFLALSGDIVDPAAGGPRCMVFLQDQFARLAAGGVRVYWAGGPSDNFARWAELWPLGDNVTRFPIDRGAHCTHHRDGQPLVQILGTSVGIHGSLRPGDFHADVSDVPALVVACGTADPQVLTRHEIRFWALGGQHARSSLASGSTLAHFPGTPQGRKPNDAGPHGCTLVQIDELGQSRTTFIATDAVRYQRLNVRVDDAVDREQLCHLFQERIGELASDSFGPDHLVDWVVTGNRALEAQLRHGKLAAELTSQLRSDHGHRHPAVWTLSVETSASAAVPAGLYQEDTVLGEFLRTVRRHVEDESAVIDLAPYVPASLATGSPGAAVRMADPVDRANVLAEVAALGVELLRPEEARP